MVAVSAINPLRVAVFAALEALAIVGGPADPRVFHAVASRGAALPFYVLDAETENESGARYGQSGQAQTVQIRCWGNDSWEAQEIYEAAKGALHGAPLAVDGFHLVNPQMERLTGFKDQGAKEDDPGPYCVVGRFSSETRVV